MGMEKLMQLQGRSRKIVLALFDIVCFLAVDIMFYLLATLADHSIPVDEFETVAVNSALLLICMFGFRFGFGIYRTVWRYTSTKAYFSLVTADCLGGVTAVLIARTVYSYRGIWHFLVVAALTALLSLMARFAYRLIYKRQQSAPCSGAVRKNAAIVGAGQLGSFLANDLRSNPNSEYTPLFFLDVDPGKIGNTVAGLPVISEIRASEYIVKNEVTDVIVTITSADGDRIATLYNLYQDLGCRVKIYDSLTHEVAGERGPVIRDFQIEDLLFRNPIKINDQKVLDYYTGKTVLVTGGGGSIGSEICRQIAT